MQRIGWRFLESVPQIPSPRLLVLRVNQENTHADRVGRLHTPKDHVLQKRSSETLQLTEVALDLAGRAR